MANTNSAIRFDHKEIAVIFSLFIFVALLMFTVGILVGKGLAQAQYSGGLAHEATPPRDVAEVTAPNPASLGTSVTTDKHEEEGHPAEKTEHEDHAKADPHASDAKHEPAAHEAKSDGHGEAHGKTSDKHAKTEPHSAETPDLSSPSATMSTAKNLHAAHVDEEVPHAAPALKLIPKKPGLNLENPTNREAEHVINDPKLASLFEDAKGPAPKKIVRTTEDREVASTDPLAGAETGKFTLQVGSYPSKKDADDRVTNLKKLGFSYSYTSAKVLEGSKDTWYRVWLGYYQDEEAAKKSGEALQARNEIKNYIVKKTGQQD